MKAVKLSGPPSRNVGRGKTCNQCAERAACGTMDLRAHYTINGALLPRAKRPKWEI